MFDPQEQDKIFYLGKTTSTIVCTFVCCIVCIVVVVLCVFLSSYVYLFYYLCIAVFNLDAGLLVRSQYSEGPATSHLDRGFWVSLCL